MHPKKNVEREEEKREESTESRTGDSPVDECTIFFNSQNLLDEEEKQKSSENEDFLGEALQSQEQRVQFQPIQPDQQNETYLPPLPILDEKNGLSNIEFGFPAPEDRSESGVFEFELIDGFDIANNPSGESEKLEEMVKQLVVKRKVGEKCSISDIAEKEEEVPGSETKPFEMKSLEAEDLEASNSIRDLFEHHQIFFWKVSPVSGCSLGGEPVSALLRPRIPRSEKNEEMEMEKRNPGLGDLALEKVMEYINPRRNRIRAQVVFGTSYVPVLGVQHIRGTIYLLCETPPHKPQKVDVHVFFPKFEVTKGGRRIKFTFVRNHREELEKWLEEKVGSSKPKDLPELGNFGYPDHCLREEPSDEGDGNHGDGGFPPEILEAIKIHWRMEDILGDSDPLMKLCRQLSCVVGDPSDIVRNRLAKYDLRKFDKKSVLETIYRASMIRDPCGFTMLMRFAAIDARNFVQLMMDNGYDLEIVDNFGKSAYDWAEFFRLDEMCQLLSSRQRRETLSTRKTTTTQRNEDIKNKGDKLKDPIEKLLLMEEVKASKDVKEVLETINAEISTKCKELNVSVASIRPSFGVTGDTGGNAFLIVSANPEQHLLEHAEKFLGVLPKILRYGNYNLGSATNVRVIFGSKEAEVWNVKFDDGELVILCRVPPMFLQASVDVLLNFADFGVPSKGIQYTYVHEKSTKSPDEMVESEEGFNCREDFKGTDAEWFLETASGRFNLDDWGRERGRERTSERKNFNRLRIIPSLVNVFNESKRGHITRTVVIMGDKTVRLELIEKCLEYWGLEHTRDENNRVYLGTYFHKKIKNDLYALELTCTTEDVFHGGGDIANCGKGHMSVICFAMNQEKDFEDIAKTWLVGAQRFAPMKPIMLVGCRCKQKGDKVRLQTIMTMMLQHSSVVVDFLQCDAEDNFHNLGNLLSRIFNVCVNPWEKFESRNRRAGMVHGLNVAKMREMEDQISEYNGRTYDVHFSDWDELKVRINEFSKKSQVYKKRNVPKRRGRRFDNPPGSLQRGGGGALSRINVQEFTKGELTNAQEMENLWKRFRDQAAKVHNEGNNTMKDLELIKEYQVKYFDYWSPCYRTLFERNRNLVTKYVSYIGQVNEKGRKHGVGKELSSEGKIVYYGEFLFGERDGNGILFKESGQIEHFGKFKRGMTFDEVVFGD